MRLIVICPMLRYSGGEQWQVDTVSPWSKTGVTWHLILRWLQLHYDHGHGQDESVCQTKQVRSKVDQRHHVTCHCLKSWRSFRFPLTTQHTPP